MEPLKFYERQALIWKLKSISSTEKFVLLALSQYSDSVGGNCFPSAKKIAEDTRLARPTVSKTLTKLAEEKIIKITPRYKDGMQISNDYVIDFQVIYAVIQSYTAVTDDYRGCNLGLQGVSSCVTPGVTDDYTDQIQLTDPINNPITGEGDREKNEPTTQGTTLVANSQDSEATPEIKEEYIPPQRVTMTAKRSSDLGGLRGSRADHKAIAVEHISAFASPAEKEGFKEWAKTKLQEDYPQAIAFDKAGWCIRNLDQNKQDDLLAVELLKRYRAISAKSEQQGASTSIVDRLIVLAKSNPLEAQKQANETERSKGLPQNFYWNKILGAL